MESTKISVISDTHLLPEYMVSENEEFKKHMQSDRKLIAESEGLLNAAMDMVHDSGAKVLFVTGDMTKDGELMSHKEFKRKMEQFIALDSDRRVFLIPGNHDINNRGAYNYNAEGMGFTTPTPTVTPIEFMEVYSDIVYNQAFNLYKDSRYFKEYLARVNANFNREEKYRDFAHGYTSYASRMDLDPSKKGTCGLTVIGLDTCKYSIDVVEEKEDGCQNTAGVISIEQLRWLVEVCEEANRRNDVIIALAHHAFIPHFNNQEKALAPYIIDNSKEILEDFDPRIDGKTPVDVLADMGVKFIFTGHMHAQDIAKKISPNGNPIYDVETGSTVTYPLPVRHMKLKNLVNSYSPRLSMRINTELISEFEFNGPEGKDFIRVKDALEHASQNLITPELLEGLVGEYVLPNLKLDARDMASIYMEEDFRKLDFFEYLRNNVLKDLDKDGHMLIKKKPTYKITLDLEKNHKEKKRDNAFIFTIKSLGQTFSYRFKKKDFNKFINEVLDAIDENLVSNHRLILKWVRITSEHFLNFELKDSGNIRTVSDFANEAYLGHLLGDEKASPEFTLLLEDLYKRNIMRESALSMKKSLISAIEDFTVNVRYDGLIKKYLHRITKNNKFFGKAVDKRVYKYFGSSLLDLLKSMKLSPKKVFKHLMDLKTIDEFFENQSKELLDLAHALSSEAQKEYKSFAYFEDNNTYIEEALIRHERNDEALNQLDSESPSSDDRASRALMYVDILTIGALLFLYMNKKNRR